MIPLAALAGLALALPTLPTLARADGHANRPDVMSVSELRKGMKGYGLTVFEGTEPERFDVEVIDVLSDFRPHQELILIKTMHPRLDVTKIVAGMSGSPIFIDGKMIGAYSYGWTFGVEPVAGVTPIRNMLDDLERPLPKSLRGAPLKLLPTGQHASRSSYFPSGKPESDSGRYDLREHARRLAPALERTGLTPVSTPLLVSGMTPSAVEAARELLEPLGMTPLQAGSTSPKNRKSGAGKKGATPGFVDGGAIGVSLVRGDVSAMGLGTVTRVEGDRLVAFGHPMMNVGVTSLPTSRARVLWFMASQMRSFKMGEALEPLGTLVNDRQASIVVHQDARPHTLPVTLHIDGAEGAPFSDWEFEVASDRFVTPAFLAMTIGSALESAAGERRDVTYNLRSSVKFVGYPALRFDDFGSSPTGTPGTSDIMRSDIVESVGTAYNNPWEHAVLESVSVVADLEFAREVATLRGVEVLTPEVEPGEPVRLRVVLEPYGMKRQVRTLSVPLPESLAGQSVTLEVRPGYEVERPRPQPEDLGELLSNLQNATEMPRSLVISYETGEGGAAYRGVVVDSLPPAVLDRLTNEHSSVNVAQFKSERHQVVPLPYYVVGKDRATVQVKSAH
jgi:hypothetical protein